MYENVNHAIYHRLNYLKLFINIRRNFSIGIFRLTYRYSLLLFDRYLIYNVVHSIKKTEYIACHKNYIEAFRGVYSKDYASLNSGKEKIAM